ncbi:MAG: riboflavin kinase [Alistipes sp.]|jgi:riboflavin kinase/FMN adenylyltransferase|nr:riboflavin kinase [Alistipes sp.]
MKITGRVVEGSRVGRRLGYPTANIAVPDDLAADNGVWAAVVESGRERHDAIANLGVKPTFGEGGPRMLELHLFDFEGDLYGRTVTARLLKFVRPERKFATPEALRAQIEKDEKTTKNILRCISTTL